MHYRNISTVDARVADRVQASFAKAVSLLYMLFVLYAVGRDGQTLLFAHEDSDDADANRGLDFSRTKK